MNLEEFLADIQNRIVKLTGPDSTVNLQEVRKNNNVILHGITILNKGQNISPTVYLDDFYAAYLRGMSLDKIADKVLAIYLDGMPDKEINMLFFRDFEQVKGRISYRLINRAQNEELLKDIPHVDFLDLAICFYYAFHSNVLGDGTILIRNSHLEMWNTCHKELLQLAEKNAPKLFPAELTSMEELMEDVLSGEKEELCREKIPMLVLTNEKRSQGSACMLYPGMLKEAAGRLNGSFYILPSSIHEVILLKDDGAQDKEYLHYMIREINKSQVREEEILSDYPYYYDAPKGRIYQLFDK